MRPVLGERSRSASSAMVEVVNGGAVVRLGDEECDCGLELDLDSGRWGGGRWRVKSRSMKSADGKRCSMRRKRGRMLRRVAEMTKDVGMAGGLMSGDGKIWPLLTGTGISFSEVRFGGSNDGVDDDEGK